MNHQAKSGMIARQIEEFVARGGVIEHVPGPWDREVAPPAPTVKAEWVDTNVAASLIDRTRAYMYILLRRIRAGEDLQLRWRMVDKVLEWNREDLVRFDAVLKTTPRKRKVQAKKTNNND